LVPFCYDLKRNWEPDFESLEKLDLTKVKMWIGYPHMPTGARGSIALFEKFGFQKHQILMINDNPWF
jgi:aspartate/methionine/tyrosine aminotransferase